MAVIARELVFKILAIATAGGTVAGGGVVLSSHLSEAPEIEELKNIGLSCRNNYCTSIGFGEEGFSVKQDKKARTVNSLSVARGKIRVHTGKGEGLGKYTFHIEDGDIALEGKEDPNISLITRLEEFETYGIEEETVADKKKYHFKRKTKASEEIKTLLGLGESNCKFPTEGDVPKSISCELNLEKLKKIKFEGKKGEPSLVGVDSGTVTLIITSLIDHERGETIPERYPLGYSFVLSGDKEINIPTSTSYGTINKKASNTVEFRIKKGVKTDNGVPLTLERVWDVERMAWKIGLKDCNKRTGKCWFPENAIINVYKGNGSSVSGAKVTNSAKQSISFTEGDEAAGFEGEVKFTVIPPIAITGGTATGTPFNTIEGEDFEVKEQTVNGLKDWYLTEKTA